MLSEGTMIKLALRCIVVVALAYTLRELVFLVGIQTYPEGSIANNDAGRGSTDEEN